MTKKFDFNWRIPVPEALTQGCVLDRWTEEKDNVDFEPQCLFRVDEYGFFIYWKSDGNDADLLELCQVNDIRAGGLPRDPKLLNQLQARHGADLEAKSLSICSGTDMVNINLQHVILPDVETAKTWQTGLRSITNNNKINNACVRQNLEKHWMRLCFSVDQDGKITVKNIARTFASGKTEKLVYQCLGELGLPCEKVRGSCADVLSVSRKRRTEKKRHSRSCVYIGCKLLSPCGVEQRMAADHCCLTRM
ncbi:1-phosphatidylinositol 4,5-bisphosphate phosphodiesterase-like isoform X2 [Pollicipes pollicipes]|uniref:1-phosphatidylinositol 4,5-bisphosphate phosphodiesterase-like isoform X2 n=1 Tax=Pollicipes pollicipes TaxID=41117 RepID=UPI001884AEC8|nr:1-phosphatidylinositol 4,5-bisphosphate phosphodiesterase-like isoform X2 [Pollicipes pollicipes]